MEFLDSVWLTAPRFGEAHDGGGWPEKKAIGRGDLERSRTPIPGGVLHKFGSQDSEPLIVASLRYKSGGYL